MLQQTTQHINTCPWIT